MDVSETVELLFNKNNNVAYKALQELKKDILSALHKANIFVYDDSMQSLVYNDIEKAFKEIQQL